MAQIYFQGKDYEKCIFLYKQILHTIELSLLETNPNVTQLDDDIIDFNYNLDGLSQTNKLREHPTETNNTENYNMIQDERLVQMIVNFLFNFFLQLVFRIAYEVCSKSF